VVALLAAAAAATALAAPGSAPSVPRPGRPHDALRQLQADGRSGLRLGVTWTQSTLPAGDPGVTAGQDVLTSTPLLQAHPLMGWGNPNPEPAPGTYDWSGLDRQMAITAATGGSPTLTLCCAPDWMKGGRAGTTDWSRLTVAPDPEHVSDFAALAVAAAKRYPQVRAFVVWNELKGYWSSSASAWRIQAYTMLYNAVYTALKSYDPSLAVGGPYVHVNAYSDPNIDQTSTLRGCWGTADQRDLNAITYWLAHAKGADFVAVDGGTTTRDGVMTCRPMLANHKFEDVTRWLRQRTRLPVWWTEIYPQVQDPQVPDTDGSRTAVTADALRVLDGAGAAAAFLWSPEAGDQPATALWTSTSTATGGQALPLATCLRDLAVTFRRAGAGATPSCGPD